MLEEKKYSIGIVGGYGKMGSFFSDIFRKHTSQVFQWGRKSPESLEEFCKEKDIIIVCVPIDKTEEIRNKLIQ